MTRYRQKDKTKKIRELTLIEINKADFLKKEEAEKAELARKINLLLKNCWDEFEIEYIYSQIFNSDKIILLFDHGKMIGISAAKYLVIQKKPILYIELTAIEKEYQNQQLSKIVNAIFIKKYLLINVLKGKMSFFLMGVTPNIRVLSSLSRIVNDMYPNPNNQVVGEAPDLIWAMSKELLQRLGKPYSDYSKKLDRTGNIIRGYYFDKPELLKNIQKGYDNKEIEGFVEKYMSAGEEILFVAKITSWDLLKYYFKEKK